MQFISETKELQCKEHKYKIIKIGRSQNIKMGERVKCEKCEFSGDFIHIDDFLNELNQKKKIVEEKLTDNLKEFEEFSNPLEQVLKNYKDEFNSTIVLILNEVQKVKQQIHEYFSIFDNPLESQSLSDFEQICHKVYSNVFDKFNLKKKYFELFGPMKQLIKIQKFYSNKLITCFKQIQDDMTNYEHIYNFKVQGRGCTAMCMGQSDDTQVIAMALENQLKIYELIMEQKKVIEKQSFKHFTHNIADVMFSEDNKYLVAGGTFDKRMNIYVECEPKKKKYELKAEIIYKDPIFSIIFTPNNEDLISASGNDLFCIHKNEMEEILDLKSQQIQKIDILNHEIQQKKKDYQLNPSHNNTVYQLNHYQVEKTQETESKQKLISCSYDKQIFIWEKKKDTWTRINSFRVQNSVYRCCFVGDDSIVVQENSSRYLKFYNAASSKEIVHQTYEFNDLNTDLSHIFPMIYLRGSNLLIVKHNSKIVFFRKRKNGIFYKEDEKNGEIGTITFNSQHYLSWDRQNQKVRIYQQMSKFQVPKELFEERCLQNQSRILEESNIQNLLVIKSQEENQFRAQNSNVDTIGLHSNDIKLEIKKDIKLEIKKDILPRDINTDDDRGGLVDLSNSNSPKLVQFN